MYFKCLPRVEDPSVQYKPGDIAIPRKLGTLETECSRSFRGVNYISGIK